MRKTTEELIGQTLAGMRDAEPSAGMERRILAAMEERAQAVEPVWRRWMPLWSIELSPRRVIGRRWAWRGAVAGALMVCAFILTLTSKPHAPMQAKMVAVLPAVASRGVEPVAQQLSHIAVVRVKGREPARRAGLVNAGYSRRSRGMRGDSYPAPAEPLTEQERLLLRVVRRGDDEELAMLDPAIRSRREAAGKVEFQQFFEGPTKGEHE